MTTLDLITISIILIIAVVMIIKIKQFFQNIGNSDKDTDIDIL